MDPALPETVNSPSHVCLRPRAIRRFPVQATRTCAGSPAGVQRCTGSSVPVDRDLDNRRGSIDPNVNRNGTFRGGFGAHARAPRFACQSGSVRRLFHDSDASAGRPISHRALVPPRECRPGRRSPASRWRWPASPPAAPCGRRCPARKPTRTPVASACLEEPLGGAMRRVHFHDRLQRGVNPSQLRPSYHRRAAAASRRRVRETARRVRPD